MCAMALVHSRVRVVAFREVDSDFGGLGGAISLHQCPSLNHQFRVLRWEKVQPAFTCSLTSVAVKCALSSSLSGPLEHECTRSLPFQHSPGEQARCNRRTTESHYCLCIVYLRNIFNSKEATGSVGAGSCMPDLH